MPANLYFLDDCIWVAVSGGSGPTYEFSAAVTGHNAPADCTGPVVVDGGTYTATLYSDDLSQRLFAYGTWDVGAGELTITEIVFSTNSGMAVNFTDPPSVIMGGPTANTMSVAPQPVTVTTTPADRFVGPVVLISPIVVQGRYGLYSAPVPWVGDFGLYDGPVVDMATVTDISVNMGGIFNSALGVQTAALLGTLSAPNLEVLVGGIEISSCPALTTLNMPRLRYLQSGLLFNLDTDMPLLTEVSLPALVEASNNLVFNTGSTLESVSLPELKSASLVTFTALTNAAFTEVDLPSFLVGGFSINSCPNVTTISTPSWTGPGEWSQGGGMDALTLIECGGNNALAEFTAGNGAPLLATVDLSTAVRLGSINLQNADTLTTLTTTNITTLGDADGTATEITNCPLLTTVAFPALMTVDFLLEGSYLGIIDLAACTSVDLSAMISGNFDIGVGSSLTTLTITSTVNCPGLWIGIHDCPNLTPLDYSNFTHLFALDLSVAEATLDISSLIDTDLTQGGVLIVGPNLTSIDLSALTQTYRVSLLGNNPPGPVTVDLSSLSVLTSDFDCNGGDAIPSISLPAITTIGDGTSFNGSIYVNGTTGPTAFSLGAGLLSVDGTVTVAAALDEASVDGILASLAALDGTGGTTSYDNSFVSLTGNNAPPSAAGLVNKAILEGRGNTVQVN